MPNPYGAPETDVRSVAEKIAAGDEFILLDVREPLELQFAKLDVPQFSLAPLSALAREGVDALPEAARERDAEIIVLCHHGVRSAQVTAWLLQNGWTNVVSLEGGIDAYARDVDPEIGFY